MATKYSDFIHLQDFLPIYDILEESSTSWQSFIPTAQFNDLLRRSLTAITSPKEGNEEVAIRKATARVCGFAVHLVPVKAMQAQ